MATESAYLLGARVTVLDYLRRVVLRRTYERDTKRERDRVAALWPDVSTPDRNGVRPSKFWIAASVHDRLFTETGMWIATDQRNNPSVSKYALTLPIEGIVTGKVTLQDGRVQYEDGMTIWYATRSYTAYRVAYHLSRRPLTVLPSMIQAVA